MPALRRPLVGAHYYTWYFRQDGRPWGNGMTDAPASPMPRLGWYNSNDPEIMDAHIAGMEQAGFDFALVNIVAEAPHSWENVHRFHDRLNGRRLRFAVTLDGLYEEGPDVKAAWVEKAKREFAWRPNYVAVEGGPLVVLFSSPLNFESEGVTLRNLYWTPDYRDGSNTFNGGPLEPRDWPFWAPTPQPLINRLVPVVPGYRDTHLNRPRAMELPRRDGATYHEQWERAVALRPDITLVYSWNEHFEQTAIEPTDAWGDRYVTWTACYAQALRGGQPADCRDRRAGDMK
jgi:hypothetical protein